MQTKTTSLDTLIAAIADVNLSACKAELDGVKNECSNALSNSGAEEIASLQEQLTKEQEVHAATKKDLVLANEEIALLTKKE